ncbi:hypothetical protein MTP09_07475 [Chryseobacterium suipulveris]|uniref:Lipoprotein n=1 Tax=Chryseobacterium suipulveris TaxID=2929800 RepID=A0ABY4BPP4_9FLAO|nr:hypothetical protein [Chryseobacterium suipulveris]UOE39766.1 hypothetical protein MTP09_07475 [Chryseobacterium suipulveris]
MKTIFKSIAVLAVCAVLFISCNRSEDPAPNNPLPAAAGFTWRENDPNGAVKTAGSSEVRTQYKSIFAFAGPTATSGTIFEINLTGTVPATYDLATSGNALYYGGFGPGGTITGKVIITKNDGSKASGTLEAFTTASGNITKVYGTFTDIPVK